VIHIGLNQELPNSMKKLERGLEPLVFASRWIQAPVFWGLILVFCG
jgi:hypothetical protein